MEARFLTKPNLALVWTSKFRFANSEGDSVTAHCPKTRVPSNGGRRKIHGRSNARFGSDVQCLCVCVFSGTREPTLIRSFFVKRKKKQSIIKHGGVYEMMCLYTEYIFWFYPKLLLPYKFIPFFLLKPHDPSHWHKYIKIVNPLSFWSFSWNLFLSIVIFIRNTNIVLIEYITSNIIINYEMSVLNFKIYVIINYKCINTSNICNFFQNSFVLINFKINK